MSVDKIPVVTGMTKKTGMTNGCNEGKSGRLGTLAQRIAFTWSMARRYAFTMAEILLSLTIIGVVAAITLPSLTGNINERTWNTQRKALYARISQAVALMPALNGFGNYNATYNSEGSLNITEDTAAETFIASGLSKVLKINNICDNQHLADCGIVSSYTNFLGSASSIPTTLKELNPFFTNQNGAFVNPQAHVNTKAVAFESANGESILTFYNPICSSADMVYSDSSGYIYIQPKMCVNFIYDLNGNRGPNTVGKDIGFITVLYPTDSIVVAPVLASRNEAGRVSQEDAFATCRAKDEDSRVPNIDELSSIFYNKYIIGFVSSAASGGIDNAWSSTVENSTKGWLQDFNNGGYRFTANKTREDSVRCIKR